jgi:hypothetical protein
VLKNYRRAPNYQYIALIYNKLAVMLQNVADIVEWCGFLFVQELADFQNRPEMLIFVLLIIRS